jgi:hypothetical protein
MCLLRKENFLLSLSLTPTPTQTQTIPSKKRKKMGVEKSEYDELKFIND